MRRPPAPARRARSRREDTSRRRLVQTVAVLAALAASQAAAVAPPPEVGDAGMVVAAVPQACEAGRAVLEDGGNAADAAVAVGFALAVAYPWAGNLGGGGFAIHRTATGEAEAIDFREVAPARAHRDMFVVGGEPDPELSLWSPLAAGVPGTVAGLALLHERHGSLPWSRLVEPAVVLAREGIVVDRLMAARLRADGKRLRNDPVASALFVKGDGFLAEGDTLRQPDLARTLARIALHGPSDFYEGETARILAGYMQRAGGLISEEDLRGYRPQVREPLRGTYKGHTILTMPPPSSGGVVVIEILNILESFPLADWGWGSSRGMHVLAEAMRRAFADRAAYLGDPDFAPIPVAGLTDRAYADSLAGLIRNEVAARPARVRPGRPRGAEAFEAAVGEIGILPSEGGETTHYGVVDAAGNAVALTTTINAGYGSGIMVEGAGFLLNNEMDDFAAQPGTPNYFGLIQGEANAVAPFKRPLSSMTPLLALRSGLGGGELHLVLGSPGGPRIISAVLQVFLNVVTHGMEIQEAVAAPRLHHQWRPDTVWVERAGWATEALNGLRSFGQSVVFRKGQIGAVHSILVDSTGVLFGAPDPRRGGCAASVSGR